ncbi:uncharacterized protein si:ch211-142k18.1 [Pungitius pungitius]|uniref:uncharacterized protein si:ch211-142k18.1 n=1 Tax=Pungitius pungitius TaxID=134920 RepID=UPI002E122191
MWCCWTHFVLAWVSMATPTSCQSGDWGSGFEMDSAIAATNETSRAVGDEPVRIGNNQDWMTSAAFSPSLPPKLQYEPQPGECSVHFSTTAASARRLRAQREELVRLQALQRANKALMENLEQFVGAELGGQSYKDVIKENVDGIAKDNSSCHEVVEKAEEDMQKQLEGEESSAGMQKMRDESLAFEDLLRVAGDIAGRLETSSQALHASFSKQLKDVAKIHR